MANEHASRSHRRSSVVFPNEPDSERGAFLNFLEESGANAILMDAIRALYDCPEKPDAPLQWLRNYFRQQAPSRTQEIKEMKETMRQDLLELQASIFLMQEEAERKEQLVKVLQGAKGDADFEPSSPLPEREDYYSENNKELRAETRWRLQPDPFLRASCSAEEVIPARDLHVIRAPQPSIKSDSLMPEDYGEEEEDEDYGEEHTLVFPTTADDDDFDEDDTDDNDRKDTDLKEQEWVKAYNVYKKTSQLPDINNPVTSRPQGPETLSKKPSDSKNSVAGSKSTLKAPEKPPHPDALPSNLWAPGFHLVTDLNNDESSDSDDNAMIDHENDELGRTKSELYYKASRGNSRYVLRPQREQIIYENEWELWNSLERATSAGGGDDSPIEKPRRRQKTTSKTVHGPAFKSTINDLRIDSADPALPSTNSAQIGSSTRNLIDLLAFPNSPPPPASQK